MLLGLKNSMHRHQLKVSCKGSRVISKCVLRLHDSLPKLTFGQVYKDIENSGRDLKGEGGGCGCGACSTVRTVVLYGWL